MDTETPMSDQHVLQARFASPFSVVQTAWWLTDAEHRTGQIVQLRLLDADFTLATGPAEAVMLLIGRMAASNHTSLIAVHTEPTELGDVPESQNSH